MFSRCNQRAISPMVLLFLLSKLLLVFLSTSGADHGLSGYAALTRL